MDVRTHHYYRRGPKQALSLQPIFPDAMPGRASPSSPLFASSPSGSAAAKAAGVACEAIQVEGEHPYQAIIDTAASKWCDLIVMASHGRRGIAALLLGSETVKVLTHSKIPVLVHR
jgi:hypothetical protein